MCGTGRDADTAGSRTWCGLPPRPAALLCRERELCIRRSSSNPAQKPSSSGFTSVGCSSGAMWPAAGTTSSLAPGIASAISRISATGEIASLSPTITSVGTAILGKSACRSGRSAIPRRRGGHPRIRAQHHGLNRLDHVAPVGNRPPVEQLGQHAVGQYGHAGAHDQFGQLEPLGRRFARVGRRLGVAEHQRRSRGPCLRQN